MAAGADHRQAGYPDSMASKGIPIILVLPQPTVVDSLTSRCIQSHLCSIQLQLERLKANSSVISCLIKI
jgi:hypothetical protein